MGKGKLAKFADMETYENVFQYPYSVVEHVPFEMQGHWHEQYFHNDNPIVLELGCGKGEYTVELAKLYPDMNFIGVDIKGARMWTGATQAIKEGLKNVAFLRTNIEIIERFFSIIHLKTDSNFLFTYTSYMVEKNSLPVIFKTEDLYNSVECRTESLEFATAPQKPSESESAAVANSTLYTLNSKLLSIRTYYESMWIARGLNIKYMKWQLPRTGALEEPDVEIELDDYRSYHRSKRSSLDKAK